MPARECDYDGPVMAKPADPRDHADWEYGIGKRACEDALQAAWAAKRFPGTRVRIPIVNGERDTTRRLEGYLWRLLDGGPVLMPDAGTALLRHVYAGDVVRFLRHILGDPVTQGQQHAGSRRAGVPAAAAARVSRRSRALVPGAPAAPGARRLRGPGGRARVAKGGGS